MNCSHDNQEKYLKRCAKQARATGMSKEAFVAAYVAQFQMPARRAWEDTEAKNGK